ncbi:telomere-protecting terminal protein Tpg [Kitasatospora sp. NPDC054795]
MTPPARRRPGGPTTTTPRKGSPTGEIDEGLARAERTRPIPQFVQVRMRFLLKGAKGSTEVLAAELGVSRRTVQRWFQGRGNPKPAAAKKIEEQVRAKWQPKVRDRTRKAAETNGFMLHISGTFGCSSAVGSTDDPRSRTITHRTPHAVAQKLCVAP